MASARDKPVIDSNFANLSISILKLDVPFAEFAREVLPLVRAVLSLANLDFDSSDDELESSSIRFVAFFNRLERAGREWLDDEDVAFG